MQNIEILVRARSQLTSRIYSLLLEIHYVRCPVAEPGQAVSGTRREREEKERKKGGESHLGAILATSHQMPIAVVAVSRFQ